eukprot:gnl/TRDRNA2_/TRDRNA2_87854_c0_seq1.p1 gnl/TRDRNA2_/TRDRNA2_87854_c0~~gnl/TRDRNA2_/TRDRNA2_87854_c0_seq1.p1  ORF type:complete len:284 (-),score=59.29 gnl/TRDRNA2_/TRDRNA2_87854_c0_seq1:80-865(-)
MSSTPFCCFDKRKPMKFEEDMDEDMLAQMKAMDKAPLGQPGAQWHPYWREKMFGCTRWYWAFVNIMSPITIFFLVIVYFALNNHKPGSLEGEFEDLYDAPMTTPEEAQWLEFELFAAVIPESCQKLSNYKEVCDCYTGCWVHGDDSIYCFEDGNGIFKDWQDHMMAVMGMGYGGIGRVNWALCAGIMCSVYCQNEFGCYTAEAKATCQRAKVFMNHCKWGLPFWEQPAECRDCPLDCDKASSKTLWGVAFAVLALLLGMQS